MLTSFPDALPANTNLQNGNFTVLRVLGQGGFGITYVASDNNLRREVAIKEFFPQGCLRSGTIVQPSSSISADEYSSARETFLDEARTLAQFSNVNIVDVYSVFAENNSAYMVMELLRGNTLQQVVESRGALPQDEAIGYTENVANALEAVHGAGLLHQDIKPDNVMVCDDGRVVLIDFSLSRKQENETGLGTRRFSGAVRSGTPGYAPLEQYARQAQVGTYTDVYSLAATLYHMLTGKTPVEATDRAAGTDMPGVQALNPSISAGLSQAVMQALSMEPRNRPQTARAFMDSLRDASASTQYTDVPATNTPVWPPENTVRVSLPEYAPPGNVPPSYAPPSYAPPSYAPPEPEFEHQGTIYRSPAPVPYQEPDPLFQPHIPNQSNRPTVRFMGCGGCGPVGCIIMMFMLFFGLNFLGTVLRILFGFEF
ncbi:MAG TPA: protein kinase [Abditibacteriaceae bacterium]|jgi:serine/threonine protein kinase